MVKNEREKRLLLEVGGCEAWEAAGLAAGPPLTPFPLGSDEADGTGLRPRADADALRVGPEGLRRDLERSQAPATHVLHTSSENAGK